MVKRIEEYGNVLKVYVTGERVFYADSSSLDLVRGGCWNLTKAGAMDNDHTLFHRRLMESFGENAECIEHINGRTDDNLLRNLKPVSRQQDQRNRQSRGYRRKKADGKFRAELVLDGSNIPGHSCRTEFDAVLSTRELRAFYYSDFDYSFLLDRRGDSDILDWELTGRIGEEEATFRHVMRYAKDNAWYVYRYGLEDYFRHYNVPIPQFRQDSEGFMCHPVTGERLCPFWK